MNKTSLIPAGLLTLTLACATMVQAATPDQLLPFQQRWAEIQYDLDEGERAKAFAELAERLDGERSKAPGDPDLMIWQGITFSSEAGAKGGFSALKLAKRARKLFEQAIEQNPKALQGSALTSLATLYHQVPAWPRCTTRYQAGRSVLATTTKRVSCSSRHWQSTPTGSTATTSTLLTWRTRVTRQVHGPGCNMP